MSNKIVDFHAHIFPDAMAAKVLPDLHNRAGIQYFNEGTLSDLLASMAVAGVDVSVVSRITTRPEQTESINDWLLDISQHNIIPMAAWHPDLAVDDNAIKRLAARGFKCIKLHPDYQGFFVDEKRVFPLYEAAQSAGMPILFHAGLDRGLPPPVHALPDRLLRVHRAFPQLKMIAAHMGGEDNYGDTEKLLLGSSIYLDTSFILRKMPLSTLERMIKKHPIERILFGSDNPWNDQKGDVEYLFSLPFLNDHEKACIAGINAIKLLVLE
jgi:hypothetical protein